MLSEHNLDVLTNVISAVESGGQVYGKRRYDTYADPYHISASEHTITIGWACNQGSNAKKLMQMIYDYDPEAFKRNDGTGIEQKLKGSWTGWYPNAAQKAAILRLITSTAGKKAQDDLFKSDMKKFIEDCERDFTKSVKAIMMYCEIRHLGGKAVNRIFARATSYTTEGILASLVKDQSDGSSNNQVGDKKYWSRHVKCAEFIELYADSVNENVDTLNGGVYMTSKDITICGHGSGKPSLKNLHTYSASRYSQKMSNGVRKGILCVRRPKKLTDALRPKFVEKYTTILGRNIYSQTLRQYVYKQYKNGKYYSDCSSSLMATLQQIGLDYPLFNTEAYVSNDNYFEDVPVEIKDGQIMNPEVLKIGDCIMYKGNLEHKDYVGHVEGVYAIGGEIKGVVREFQHFLNEYYPDIVTACCEGLLKEDNDYGPKTRSGALGVWKYMSNKYYGTNLTVGNDYFLGLCRKAATKMTETEVRKHPTLAYILQGILAGKGFYDSTFDAVIGAGTRNAIKKMTGTTVINANTWDKLFN